MLTFLNDLKSRNELLFWAGLLSLAGSLICAVLAVTTSREVMGVNAFVKPMKFYVSIAIFFWTMGWLLTLLDNQRAVRVYSWVIVVAMVIEMVIITWQAANGRLSHFNISSAFYGALFSLMGIVITIMTLWTAYICFLFFRQSQFDAPNAYIWGIRLGILLFVVFAFEGGIMAARLAHTVGAPDGGPGLAVLNWSTRAGDLRVAHFLGMHALQLLPLFGFYVARNPKQVLVLAGVYLLVTTGLLVQALMGKPFIG